MTLFGLSNSTIWACALRFFCGSCFGTISVTKAALNEISTSKTKPFIFSLIGIFWSLGSIIGPVVGGLFSDPNSHFPTLFSSPVFTTYPYLLPCIIQAIISLAGFLGGVLYLPETANLGVYQFLSTIDLVEEDTEELPNSQDNHHHQVFSPDPASTLFLNTTSRMDIQNMFRQLGTSHQSSFATTEELFDAHSEGIFPDDQSSIIDEDDTSNSLSPYMLSSTHIILAYGLIHFQNCFFEEIYSLWAVAPLGIGLAFTSETFGVILFFVGLVSFIFAILYSYIATSSVKILLLYQMSYLIYLLVWIFLPYIAWIMNENHTIWIQSLLFIALSLRRLANILAFTSANILLQYSTTPMSLGSINGMAATLGSFFRSIGPITAGVLWSYSTIEGNAPPFNKHLVFFVLSCLSVLGFLHSFYLRSQYG